MEGPKEFSTLVGRPARRAALDAAVGGLHWCGLSWVYARARRQVQATILIYHSVPGPEDAPWIDPANAMAPAVFERQMEFLAARRRVISMGNLLEELRAGTPPRPGTVVITFDDGYRDNLGVVAPILARLGLPAILYLPTALVTRGETQWIDRLYTAVRWRRREALTWTDGTVLRFGGDGEVPRSYRTIASSLLVSSAARREEILRAVEAGLNPRHRPPRQTMTWDEVRRLRDEFPAFEVGVHSVNHIDLTSCGPGAAEEEIRGSVAEAGRELGAPPVHFAFPYARSSPETRRLVAAAGLASAVIASDDPVVRPGASPWALPRVLSPESGSLFRMMTGGAYPDLPRLLWRRP